MKQVCIKLGEAGSQPSTKSFVFYFSSRVDTRVWLIWLLVGREMEVIGIEALLTFCASALTKLPHSEMSSCNLPKNVVVDLPVPIKGPFISALIFTVASMCLYDLPVGFSKAIALPAVLSHSSPHPQQQVFVGVFALTMKVHNHCDE